MITEPKEFPHLQLEGFQQPLAALAEIARVISVRSGQREMLADVLDVLERDLGMSRGVVMLLSLDENELLVEASGKGHKAGRDVRYQRGEGITGQVLQTGQAAMIPRISEEPRFQNRIHDRRHEHGHELSFICVPVALANEVVGTLSVDFPFEGEAALPEKERVLNIVASMIANDVKMRRMAKIEREQLEAENLRLRFTLGETFRPESIIGNSQAMESVYRRIHLVAPTDTTVLICGESGTGKELVASAIHCGSKRAQGPFVRVNCAQLTESLFESELFGHERGAFTGAFQERIGRLEEARGGTILFDEIGEFSPAIQVKLLRVLQEREFQRVGSNKTLKAEVRVIAATNKRLEQSVEEGVFRQDLYYRINVFPVYLPALRERKDDIPGLADHFAAKYARKLNKEIHRISPNAINMMLSYGWPGNVRELEHCMEYAALMCTDGVIRGQNLPPTLQMPDSAEIMEPGSLTNRMHLLEKELLAEALKRHSHNACAVARELGITPRMVRYRMKRFGL
ncbi:TPA: sigma-54-dependent Fis family transcriptional regulator [Candidatus Sumerlaeota bacterium]|jgi:Nif-specific regulatory protein|nr:sigma-54-dependent Fis family transcriptional regulator [Candidatus Sumerlaeota bacterium]